MFWRGNVAAYFDLFASAVLCFALAAGRMLSKPLSIKSEEKWILNPFPFCVNKN